MVLALTLILIYRQCLAACLDCCGVAWVNSKHLISYMRLLCVCGLICIIYPHSNLQASHQTLLYVLLLLVVCSAVAANAATLLMQSASSNGGPPPPKKFLGPGALDFAELASSAAASGDLSFPRRERFVFRPTHLEVLEKYFQDNNYPSFETREEIAQMCNQISESAGMLLNSDVLM